MECRTILQEGGFNAPAVIKLNMAVDPKNAQVTSE